MHSLFFYLAAKTYQFMRRNPNKFSIEKENKTMLKLKQYVKHDFVLLMDGDYEDEVVTNLASRIGHEFEVKVCTNKDEKFIDEDNILNDWFDRGNHAIKIRTEYHTFDRIRKYMYALGFDDEYGYISLVKHDQEDFYSVM